MRRFSVLAASAAFLLPTSIAAQDVPPDIAQWDILCFCSATVATPHVAVRADNNGRILYAARGGITAEQLRASGIPVLDSQLYFLRDYHLLSRNENVWKTSIPTLGPPEMRAIRALLRGEAAALVRKTANDVHALSSALSARGFPDNAYSVLFSYVLDGLTWSNLDELKLSVDSAETVEHPFWSGVFWAVYPKRENVPGTNGHSKGKVEIQFTWTDAILPLVTKMQESPGLNGFLQSVPGQPSKEALSYKDGGSWRLTAQDGRFLVPLIDERAADPIRAIGQRIANAYVDRIRDRTVLDKLKRIIGTQRDDETITIALHEFIWEGMDGYVSAGIVKRPNVLAKPEIVTSEDIRKATLLIVHN